MSPRKRTDSAEATPKRTSAKRSEIRRGDMVIVHGSRIDYFRNGATPHVYYARVVTSFLVANGTCTVIVETPDEPCKVVCLDAIELMRPMAGDA